LESELSIEEAPMAERLGDLILYVAEKCKDDSSFGATKLNKLLFMIDFIAYGAWGKSISGSTYIRLPNGPAPRELLSVQGELIGRAKARLEERPYFGYVQKRIVPIESYTEGSFSSEELELINQVIETCEPMNATQLSDWSHTLTPWLLARDREEIPYYTVFTLRHVPAGNEGIKWGLSRLKELRAEGKALC